MNSKIEIELNSKEDYINKFNSKRISSELNSYILDELKTINVKDNLDIIINCKFHINNKDREKLISMIKLSYNDDIVELNYLSRNLFIKDSIIFIISIVILLLYYLSNNLPVMSDIILIVGWVLLWEVIYNVFFSRTLNNIKLKKRIQLVNSNIVFK